MNKEEAIEILIATTICNNYDLNWSCNDCEYDIYHHDCPDGEKVAEAIKYLREEIRVDEINRNKFK